ncbi:FAD-dependent oxidoreductase [Tessaracoccus sp. G1721]
MSHRIVVVGHGMVGHRFLADLASHRLDDVEVTVLGEEGHAAYNRILLPDVIMGRADLPGLTLPESRGVRILRARKATGIDRRNRTVTDSAGEEHHFDTLVLATGAEPVFPTVDGVVRADGTPMPGVAALRTWDDADRVRSAAAAGARVVVMGGGVLGIEAAVALAEAGSDATIVHRGSAPLDRQFDPASGAVVRAGLTDRGITTLVDVRVAGMERRRDHSLASVRLTSGKHIPADLLLVAIGVRPRTRLAEAAELWVRNGILVNDTCRTDDPAIYAIGDCARTPQGCPGLVGPGWEQARVLAHHLAEKISGRSGPRPVLGADSGVFRVKAEGLEAVTMGEFPADEFAPGAPRVLSLTDPVGRRRVRVAVADGLLVGATCVGDPQVAADLTVAFDSRTPVPDDPAALLARPLAGAAPAMSVADLPDAALVCRCNAVTKAAITDAVRAGADTPEAVATATRASTGCGSCTSDVCSLVAALCAPGTPRTSLGRVTVA